MVVALCVTGVGALHLAAARASTGATALSRRPHAEAPWIDAVPGRGDPDDRAVVVHLPGADPVAIFRHAGHLSAVSNVCAHQNGPLGEGAVVDGCITCPWHGYQYRLEDGCAPPPFHERLPTYRLRVEHGMVLLDPRANPPGTRVEPVPIA